jgi:hypothetical protein
MAAPGLTPISIGNVGADGLYVLTPGVDEEYGPLDLLTVTPELPGGRYEFSARVLDPVTGEVLNENIQSFDVSTASPQASSPGVEEAPLVSLEFQMGNARYSFGDTVSLASYRLANHGASSATIEVKVWLESPGHDPIAVFSMGADRTLVLTPGSQMSLSPMESFTVTENLPAGTYQLKSRVLNPITGQTYYEGAKAFEIR